MCLYTNQVRDFCTCAVSKIINIESNGNLIELHACELKSNPIMKFVSIPSPINYAMSNKTPLHRLEIYSNHLLPLKYLTIGVWSFCQSLYLSYSISHIQLLALTFTHTLTHVHFHFHPCFRTWRHIHHINYHFAFLQTTVK